MLWCWPRGCGGWPGGSDRPDWLTTRGRCPVSCSGTFALEKGEADVVLTPAYRLARQAPEHLLGSYPPDSGARGEDGGQLRSDMLAQGKAVEASDGNFAGHVHAQALSMEEGAGSEIVVSKVDSREVGVALEGKVQPSGSAVKTTRPANIQKGGGESLPFDHFAVALEAQPGTVVVCHIHADIGNGTVSTFQQVAGHAAAGLLMVEAHVEVQGVAQFHYLHDRLVPALEEDAAGGTVV